MIRNLLKPIIVGFLIYSQANFGYAQTASLLPNALQQYFDSNGNPVSSGTVDFYIPNTSTRKNTWSDSTETTLNTNPVVLDSAGRPNSGLQIYGDGAYRQVLKDSGGNLIWDKVTNSTLGPGSASLVGDGQAVSTVKPWAGIVAPSQYVFSYGQELSRTTYSVLLGAITQASNVVCTSGSPIVTGLSDTSQVPNNASIELSCVAAGTTVLSKTASTLTLSANASVTANAVATIFPYGNGNGTTTFNLPDLRGFVLAGRNNMGGTAAARLTSAFFATNPNALGAAGGSQSHTMLLAELASHTHTATSVVTDPGHFHSYNSITGGLNAASGSGITAGSASFSTGTKVTGVTVATTNANAGSGTAFATLQPTYTINYVIKVLPDVSISTSTVVTSIQGMTGDITCGSGMTCTGNVISSSGGGSGTPGGANTQVQFNSSSNFGGSANLTWVSPILAIGANASATGQLQIVGTTSGNVTQTVQAAAGSPVVTWGTSTGTPAVTASSPLAITNATGNITCVTCATSANNLSFFASTTSAQFAGIISDATGSTGLVVLNNTPTLIAPVLGVATATSINGLTLTASTGTLTITNGKTHSVANSIALAGVDSSTITFQATDTYVGRATTDTLTNKTYDTAGTGNVFKINGTSITAIAGNTATVGTTSGVLTSGHCVSIDANLNFVDAGGACTTGGGGGTVNSGTSGQITYYGATGTAVSGNPNLTISTGALTVGLAGSVQGTVKIAGVTSGTTTFAVAAAASGTLTFPAATDTMVGRATTDTLTNKTLTTPIISSISNTGTLTLPTSTDTLIGKATTDTLTNKTYNTAGTGNAFSINGQSITSVSGNTTKVATISGVLTTNHCVDIDANGNLIDNGSNCGTVTSITCNGVALTTSGTCSTIGQVPGTTTNDNANAGNVGEYISSNCANNTTSTVTITIASPGVVTWTAHGFSGTLPRQDICPVVFTTSGALPTGITSGTTYYIIPSTITANTFQIATTVANAVAGTPVNTSGSQSGVQTITSGTSLTTATNADLTGISLTAGDWSCNATAISFGAASTVTTQVSTWLGTASVTKPSFQVNGALGFWGGSVTGDLIPTIFISPSRFLLSGTSTVFVSTRQTFTTSTETGSAFLGCRRAR